MRITRWWMTMCMWLAVVGLVTSPMAAYASGPLENVKEAACPDFNLGKQITKISWQGFFPFVIFSIPIGGSTKRLPDSRAGPICVCPGKTGYPSIGFTLGWWGPTHIIEETRQPWCIPSLGGMILTDDDMKMSDIDAGAANSQGSIMNQILPGRWGTTMSTGEETNEAYYNFHWIKFPVAYLIGWLSDMVCSKKQDGAIDIAFMSEFVPTWNNDEMALWTSPETKLFTGPWAYIACAVDGVASSIKKPIREAWWCGGTWGQIFPLSGNIPAASSGPRESSLSAAKGLALMHRFGLAAKQYGNSALCLNTRTFILEKQQYRFQMTFPIAEKKDHWIGATPFRWGEWRTIPAKGEDYINLEWSYTECCYTIW